MKVKLLQKAFIRGRVLPKGTITNVPDSLSVDPKVMAVLQPPAAKSEAPAPKKD